MSAHMVQAHKMFNEYSIYSTHLFIGIYEDNKLIELFDNFNHKLLRIFGTYQWTHPNSSDIYFVQDEFENYVE